MTRLAAHLKKRLPKGSQSGRTRAVLRELKLETICDQARCPNRVECYAHSVATFLLMGDTCTRRCSFCSVKTGRPVALDPTEPARVAEGVKRLGLRHVVLTSVDRDDLRDGGAAHFAASVRAVREANPETVVEVLTPDFRGDLSAVETVMEAAPEVFNHNLETVPRLTPTVRHRCDFERSLTVLRHAKVVTPDCWTKTGLMLGLGETRGEVLETMRRAREAEIDIVTIGQYLQPTNAQAPVVEYIEPEQFEEYERLGLEMGFRSVFSGAFVRSSYLADQAIPS